MHDKKTENNNKPNFENSKKQNKLNIQIENNFSNNNNNQNMMNSPSSNKEKKPLNTNSNNNLINISGTNPLNKFSGSNGEANNKASSNSNNNKKNAKENTKKDEVFSSTHLNINNKSEKIRNIQTTLNSTNNLNNVINIQNANFISGIQDLSHGSQQSEENIEFSSKNISSSANLFYKSKDSSANNLINNSGAAAAKQASSNPMKNQTILDQFNIKAFANPAALSRSNDTKINAFFNKTGSLAANNLSLLNSNNNSNNYNNSVNSTFVNSSNLNSNALINNINNNNSNNNGFTLNQPVADDKSIKLLKQNYLKLLEDNEKLIKDLGDKNRFVLEKEKESEKLKIILIENEQSLKSLNMLNKSYESQINLGKSSLIKYLKEFEELKRTQNKIWLNQQAYRLGKFSVQRMGHRVIEAWEDGEEINNVKNSVKQIKETKEDLEKLKKRLAAVIKKKEANSNKEKDLFANNAASGGNGGSSSSNNKDNPNNNHINSNNREKNEAFASHLNAALGIGSNGNAVLSAAANGFMHPMNIFHSSNLFSYGHNGNLEEYTEHEMLELRELINFKLARLNKEESECVERLEKLEIEKIKYQIEFKRSMEEDKCRYGSNSKEKWPVLSNRYLIFSLLGRGGYSEVYKVSFFLICLFFIIKLVMHTINFLNSFYFFLIT